MRGMVWKKTDEGVGSEEVGRVRLSGGRESDRTKMTLRSEETIDWRIWRIILSSTVRKTPPKNIFTSWVQRPKLITHSVSHAE
jgi:hypothetical protein